MKRSIEKELLEWKNSSDHKPLIVRGARQVGKSYTIESFGSHHFSDVLTINFEEKPVFATCFQSLEITQILKMISQLSNREIIPGKTLLFLDEIQNCLPALKALRYFREKMPSLHVIAAGSFLEFVLEDEPEISFPVGRVQFINMKPLSFVEFLNAMGQQGLNELIATVTLENLIAEPLHQHLMRFVRDFFFIGGMPGVVEKFNQRQSYLEAQRAQGSILDFYRLDLAKYAKKQDYKNLHVLFDRLPDLIGQHFKYSHIDPEASNPSRTYKLALHKLDLARLIHLVHRTDANGLPLRAEMDDRKFKVFFLDIGLLQYALELDEKERASELADIHRGVIAEQFVAQEMLAYIDPYADRHLFYWDRQKKGSTAEVDFVQSVSGRIVPLEVKSNTIGKLKSIRQFLASKSLVVGLRISAAPLSFEQGILSVPFYLISQLPKLIERFH